MVLLILLSLLIVLLLFSMLTYLKIRFRLILYKSVFSSSTQNTDSQVCWRKHWGKSQAQLSHFSYSADSSLLFWSFTDNIYYKHINILTKILCFMWDEWDCRFMLSLMWCFCEASDIRTKNLYHVKLVMSWVDYFEHFI